MNIRDEGARQVRYEGEGEVLVLSPGRDLAVRLRSLGNAAVPGADPEVVDVLTCGCLYDHYNCCEI